MTLKHGLTTMIKRAGMLSLLAGCLFTAVPGRAAAAGPAGWVKNKEGIYSFYDGAGQMLKNTVTPDGYYVDGQGIWQEQSYDVEKLQSVPADAGSLMVIAGYGTEARATFYVKNKDQGKWEKVTDSGGYVGRSGMGKTREGDEKTPTGLFTLDAAFGTKPGADSFQVPYLQVDDGHYWVGDSSSSYYNQMVDIRKVGNVFNKKASEHLSTYGGIAYHYCMSVGYNKEQTPGKGSAIFLHCIGGPGTGGCVAIPEADMVRILESVQSPAYILMDEGANLSRY